MIDVIDGRREAALRSAIERFYFAYRAFTAGPDRILEQRGLGRVHHRILYFIGRQPDAPVNALISTLGITKQALNAPLRQLVEMKLVSAETADHDRRVKRLSLTAAGAKLEARLTGTQMKLLDAVFSEIGPEAEAAWHQIMHTLPSKA
jgi:DNA-binding MarR family transcriptional regulator